MNSLIVTAAESAAFRNGSKTAFVVPVKGGMDARATEIVPSTQWKGYDFVARFKYPRTDQDVYEVTNLYKSPYQIGQKIYLREPWRKYYYVDPNGYTQFDKQIIELISENTEPINEYDADGWQVFNKDGSERMIPTRSAANMPRSAARTWITPVGCEVVRCRDVTKAQMVDHAIHSHDTIHGNILWLNHADGCTWFENVADSWQSYIAAKLCKSFWDANGWLFFYTSKLDEK